MMNEVMAIDNNGLAMVYEGIFKQLKKDYMFCWYIKQTYKDGGKWCFTIPESIIIDMKECGLKPNKHRIHMPDMYGTVDHNLKEMENYIRRLPIFEDPEKVIEKLREETFSEKNLKKFERKFK